MVAPVSVFLPPPNGRPVAGSRWVCQNVYQPTNQRNVILPRQPVSFHPRGLMKRPDLRVRPETVFAPRTRQSARHARTTCRQSACRMPFFAPSQRACMSASACPSGSSAEMPRAGKESDCPKYSPRHALPPRMPRQCMVVLVGAVGYGQRHGGESVAAKSTKLRRRRASRRRRAGAGSGRERRHVYAGAGAPRVVWWRMGRRQCAARRRDAGGI